MADHVCFGCNRQIGDHEPHIHVGLDEWNQKEGLATFGLDDLLTFSFCKACTNQSRRPGWQFEMHKIAAHQEGDGD